MPRRSRSPAEQRARHAARRLRELRQICPELPEDILSRVSLRTLSFAVRKVGKGRDGCAQTSLDAALPDPRVQTGEKLVDSLNKRVASAD